MPSYTDTVEGKTVITTIAKIPSVCIPRVMYFIEERKFHDVFTQLFGNATIDDDLDRPQSCVKRVDMLAREDRKTGEPYWLVFLHFHDVFRSQESDFFSEQINKNELVSIMYDQPWFWKVRKNEGRRVHTKKVSEPRIVFPEEVTSETREYQQKMAAACRGQGEDGATCGEREEDMPEL